METNPKSTIPPWLPGKDKTAITTSGPLVSLKVVPASKLAIFWTREFLVLDFEGVTNIFSNLTLLFGALPFWDYTPGKLSWLAGKFQPWRFVSPIKMSDFPRIAYLRVSSSNLLIMGFQVSGGSSRDRFDDPSGLDLPKATRGFVSDSGRKSLFKVWRGKFFHPNLFFLCFLGGENGIVNRT